jgi:hypothetical protein
MDGWYSLAVGNKQGCIARDGWYSLAVGNKQGCIARDGWYSLAVGNKQGCISRDGWYSLAVGSRLKFFVRSLLFSWRSVTYCYNLATQNNLLFISG